MTRNHRSDRETAVIGKVAVLLSLAFFTVASLQAQTSRFFGPAFFEVSNDVTAQVVADFSGDGIADVATCNGFDPGEANILLGNGDGTFEEAQTYEAGTGPLDIAAADFNGDGKLDLAVADNGNDFASVRAIGEGVSVLLGNGDGTFQSKKKFNAGPLPNSVAVADFNSDGKPDIAVANDMRDDAEVAGQLDRHEGEHYAGVSWDGQLNRIAEKTRCATGYSCGSSTCHPEWSEGTLSCNRHVV